MYDEQKIITWLQSGDTRGMEAMYDQYADAFYGIILRIVPDDQIAQDILQEAYVKIWKRAGMYDPVKGTLFTWCLNIVRNTAIDKTRSRNFRKGQKIRSLDNYVDHGEESVHPELIGMQGMVDKLEEKYRRVIDLIYFCGYTQREVEEELSIPLGTVKSRLRIGLRKLKSLFDVPVISLLITFLVIG